MTATTTQPRSDADTHADASLEADAPRAARSRHGIVTGALVVLGGYLLVVPFALSLFSRTADAEKLADRYRSFGTEAGLAQFSEHTDVVVRGGEQLLGEALPAFASRLEMSDAEFNAFVDERFPNVAVYRERAPEVFAYLTPAVAATAAQADNISAADDFPVAGVPVTAGPWCLLAAGIALGTVGLRSRAAPRRAATVVALVAGLGLAAGPLLLTWPHKVAAAEDVAEAARIGFTPAVARATTADTYMIDAAVIEVRAAMLPAIAGELGITPSDMDASVAADFPALSRFLEDWDAGLSASAHELSQSQLQFMDEFHEADDTPYRALPWLLIVPGLMVALAAGVVLLFDRGRA